MKKFMFFPIILLVLFACNSTPELSKEALQGEWQCFDFKMEGGDMDNSLREMTKQMTMKTVHIFSGDTLVMQNQILPLAFQCSFNFNEKIITCSPIGFKDVTARTYSIIDFTGEVLVLQEKVQGITATTYLQRQK